MRIKLHIALFFALLAFPTVMYAREPLRNPRFIEFQFNASYGFNAVDLSLANTMALVKNDEIWGNYYDLSIGIRTYREQSLRLGIDCGFKQEHYHYHGLGLTSGVYLNYIPIRVNAVMGRIVELGVRSDILVHSRIANAANFSYSGLNDECFNKLTLVPYFAIIMQLLPDLGVSVKYNFAIKSAFNYEKIDYYNMRSDKCNMPLSFEFCITYRIFTSGRRNDYCIIHR